MSSDTIIDLLLQEEIWAIEAEPDLSNPGFGTADTPGFVSRHFVVLEDLDDQGSAVVRLRPAVCDRWRGRAPHLVDRTFAIWATDGDEDARRHDDESEGPLHYTPCLWTFTAGGRGIARQDVADLCTHPATGLFVRRRWSGGPLPDGVADAARAGDLGGTRAFMLSEAPARLSIRCSKRFLDAYPEYTDTARSSGADSLFGPRALFSLEGGPALLALDQEDILIMAAGALAELEGALASVRAAGGDRWRIRDEDAFGQALGRLRDLLRR